MHIKKLVLSLPRFVNKPILAFIAHSQVLLWRLNGKSIPIPPPIKAKTIIAYAKKYKISNLVETGTYLGETVLATKGYFQKIYSIELGRDLYILAEKTFADDKNVKIIYGDSANVLPRIVKKINKPCVFWLDAHFSEGITTKGATETPIMEELKIISKSKTKNHLILIDDARFFTGNNGYPTIKEVKTFVKESLPKHKIYIENDIIIITPKI